MKFIISCILVIIFIFTGIFLFKEPADTILQYEKRTVNSFPQKMRLSTKGIKRYFKGIDEYFSDRVLFKEKTLNSIKHYGFLFNNFDLDLAIKGEDNWLFLGNKYNKTLKQLDGTKVLSEQDLNDILNVFVAKKVLLDKHGIDFFIMIGPNKSTIYAEFLPGYIKPAPKRYITPLVDALSEKGIAVYDPADLLLQSKTKSLLYYRTDTHWNMLGASVAAEGFRNFYNTLMPDKIPPLPYYYFENAASAEGDLVAIGNFHYIAIKNGDNFNLKWENEEITAMQFEGSVVNENALTDTKAWIYRDSFYTALSPFFSLFFKEITFFFNGEFKSLNDNVTDWPDVIIYEVVERNLDVIKP